MTKQEFYKSLIDIHKKTGQGLSGIVKINSEEITDYIDELIQEGLIIANDTGTTIGHPESNIFYTPTKGYNVWGEGYPSRNLTFVRFYLGALSIEPNGPLDPGLLFWVKDLNFITQYAEWLTKNNDSLKEMMELDDFYDDKGTPIQLSEREVTRLKNKIFYKGNKTISECLKIISSPDWLADDNKLIDTYKRLVPLYKTNLTKYQKDLEEAEYEISNIKIETKRIRTWLKNQDQNITIQSII